MIDVSGKAGSLWAGSWAPLSKYGLCSILIGRHFLHASWDRSGVRCILSDRKGNIILINTKMNKWKFITQVTPAPCLVKFGLARSDEFLVALPDCQVRCYFKNNKYSPSEIEPKSWRHQTTISDYKKKPVPKSTLSSVRLNRNGESIQQNSYLCQSKS